MLRGMRKVAGNPDLWLILFVQLFGVAAMTAPLLLSDSGRQGSVLLFTLVGFVTLAGISLAVTLRSRERGPAPWGSCAIGVAGVLLGLAFDDPRVAGVVVIAGAQATLHGAGLTSARRALAPLVFGAALFSLARFSDELFLWTAGASEFLWNFRFRFQEMMGEPMRAHAFGYARGFEALFAGGLLASACMLTRGRRRILPLALFVIVAQRFLVHAADMNSFDLWLALLPLLLVAIPSFGTDDGSGETAAAASPRLRVAGIGACGVVAALLAFWIPKTDLPSARRSVMLEGRYEVSVPDAQNPAKAKSASLGFFHRYFEGVVDDLDMVKAITPKTLEGRENLFICNLGRKLEAEEKQAILDFVSGGGKLCVLGDHTDIFGVMRFTNPLIETFGINLVFDSAIPFGRNWIGSLDTRWHPITAGLESADQIRISVGATLALSGDARPLIIARKGYSDIGDYGAPQKAFLGSWSYEAEKERMGGLVLAADARYGKGRVVVFGDTAFTQEASFSTSWSFVSGLMRDQLATGDAWVSTGRLLLAVLLLGGTIALSSALRLRPLSIALVALLTIGTAAAVRGVVHCRFQSDPLLPEKVAWLDLGEGSNLQVVAKDGNEVGGFVNALMASGYVPLVRVGGEELPLRPSDVVVLPSGGGRLDRSRTRELEEFTRAGGRVLAFAGQEDRQRYAEALEAHGLGIGSDPLGICPAAELAPELRDRVPLPGFRQAWPLELHPDSGAKSLVSCFGHPVIVEVPKGEGEWIWVADSRFAWNENFKRGENFQARNFRFLDALLKRGS